MGIVKEGETCVRYNHWILLYSEKKENYLQNIWYIEEQPDLYLVSMDIASLWFETGKIEGENYNGLEIVIMITISKAENNKFRKDMYKSKSRPLKKI